MSAAFTIVMLMIFGWVAVLARVIHDGSSRNRAVARRDGRAEPRGREADLKQSVDRPSGESACQHAVKGPCWLVAAANPRLQQKRS
jgi:hypothetical protein